MSENKVTFGLKNVHWALITETDGAVTYATPKKTTRRCEFHP